MSQDSNKPGREWIKVINQGKGYSGIGLALFRDRLKTLEKQYVFFQVLLKYVSTGDTVLEAGCGWAFSSFALARRGIRTVALDISEKLVEDLNNIRRGLGAEYEKYLEVVQGDLFQLKRLGRKFNVIVNDDTYEYFTDENDRQRILVNIGQCLEAGGKYIVAVPNMNNPFFNAVVDQKMPAIHRFDIKSLKTELERSEFQVVETGYQFVNPGFEQWLKIKWAAALVRIANNFFSYFPPFFKRVLAAHLYCVAIQKADQERRNAASNPVQR